MSDEEIAACLRVLETLAAERVQLLELPPPLRKRLLEAAGRVAEPARDEQRRYAKARRRKDRAVRRAHDAELVAETQMRQVRQLPVYVALPGPEVEALPAASVDRPVGGGADEAERFHDMPLREPRSCYVCKREFTRLHVFYDSMCPECAPFNYRKRTQTASLDGRVALVTGGRIKIGYQAALMLLRAGAQVVVTTRFAHDAALRFSREPDYPRWAERLQLHAVDLRHTPSVELLARWLSGTLPRLDILVNNAAQTVRRPSAFYAHMLATEETPAEDLPREAQRLLAAHARLCAQSGATRLLPARLSQLATSQQDLTADDSLFPIGRLDADLQQVDLRRHNSWRMTAAEVDTAELLEVHLVNAVAPFVLVRELTGLMTRDRTDEKHIVNVSAMEASFSRKKKTDKHPHTNMAKASLNMLTRTSAADYAEQGIWMNSVDTGWVTDEDPMHHVERKQRDHDFYPPLDVVDGAARVCDPFFHGLLTGEHAWGKFFKDYKPTGW